MYVTERMGALHFRMWGAPAVFKVRLSVLVLKIQDHLCLLWQLRRERKKHLHLKQDKSLCFYPFNVAAPASHWLISETQEGSSGTEECQPKAFDPLTFIRCASATTQKSDPCLHAFNGPRRTLLTVLPFSEGQFCNCTVKSWKPSETPLWHFPGCHHDSKPRDLLVKHGEEITF